MKVLFLCLLFISASYSSSYTFLMKEYNKELELEAKIIEDIAKASLHEELRIYIPNISMRDKKVYEKFFFISKTCENANFIFIKNSNNIKGLCKNRKKLFFTNNYRRLLKNKKFYGAFFWSKSRPNIVFIKNRLKQQGIILPKNYNNFIEDL